MNRYIVRINIAIAVDTEETDGQVVADNVGARLDEIVQSEEHMLSGDIEVMHLPGNVRSYGEEAEIEA